MSNLLCLLSVIGVMGVSCQEYHNPVLELFPEFKQLQEEVRVLKGMSANRSNVFFTARLHSDRKFNYDDTIVFGSIVSSEGGAYDAGTGVFTAPRKGVYLFSVTVTVYNNGYAYVYIRKNSDIIGYMHGDARRSGSGDSYNDTPSVTVVVELAEGDTVYAQSRGGSGYLWNSYTTFTGALLY